MPEGFMSGFAQGMSPMLQSLMYAQALRNSGMTNPATGAPYSADQGGGIGDWLGRQLGFTRAPYTAANPYVPSVANGGIAPATPGAPSAAPSIANWGTPIPGMTMVGGANVQPPTPPAPVGTGTTQGQRPVTFIPPWRPPPPGSTSPGPMPPMPTALNAGDVGRGSLVSQPFGYGAFGDITSAPGMAQNFQNQFGWGLPGTRQTARKYFTERYGPEPDYRQMNARGSPWSANYGA